MFIASLSNSQKGSDTAQNPSGAAPQDADSQETREWLDALSAVIQAEGGERAQGHPGPGVVELVKEGEAGADGDLAILTAEAVDDLIKRGKVVAASRLDLARSGIGIAAGGRAGRLFWCLAGCTDPEAARRLSGHRYKDRMSRSRRNADCLRYRLTARWNPNGLILWVA